MVDLQPWHTAAATSARVSRYDFGAPVVRTLVSVHDLSRSYRIARGRFSSRLAPVRSVASGLSVRKTLARTNERP
jgi:hypothetical protein